MPLTFLIFTNAVDAISLTLAGGELAMQSWHKTRARKSTFVQHVRQSQKRVGVVSVATRILLFGNVTTVVLQQSGFAVEPHITATRVIQVATIEGTNRALPLDKPSVQ